jgi:AcrR family transcriptional regulator
MARRGPRGDIDQQVILDAAMRVLKREGSISAVSLRMVARELGVAPNAIYTYFQSMAAVWHEAKERQLGLVLPDANPRTDCGRCALRALLEGIAKTHSGELLDLFQHQSRLGQESFEFAEMLLSYAQTAGVPPRYARNIILIWLSGRASLGRQRHLENERREQMRLELGGGYPLEAEANAIPADEDFETELRILLNGLELYCSCGNDPAGMRPAAAN